MKLFNDLIKTLLLMLSVLGGVNQTYAQEDGNSVLKILWQKEFDCSEGLSCSPSAIALNQGNGNLSIIGASFHSQNHRSGKFWLWDIDPNGVVLRKSILKNASEDFKMPITMSHFNSLVYNKDNIFAITQFDNLVQFLMRVGQNREVGLNKSIDEISLRNPEERKLPNILILKMIPLFNGNFLLIGRDGRDNALIVKVNEDGDRLWEKTYDFGKVEIFTDGVGIGNKGDFIVAGNSTTVKGKFPDEQCNVCILHCDSEGKLLSEKFFAGNPWPSRQPNICKLHSGNIVVIYDESTQAMGVSNFKIKAFDPNLELLWDEDVYKSKLPIGPFRIKAVPVANKGFVVAGCTSSVNLAVYEYDKDGNELDKTSVAKATFAGNLHLECSKDKAMTVSQTSSKNGPSKVKIIVFKL